jgi:hypothetical protein
MGSNTLDRLFQKIINRENDILTYGITPPRESYSAQKLVEVTRITAERLQALDVDAIVIYDLQDESKRNPAERPFPFMPTMDPGVFAENYLKMTNLPVIIYRSVGKYDKEMIEAFIHPRAPGPRFVVFVGAQSSKEPSSGVRLSEAYQMAVERAPEVLLGGVLIPERHASKNNEHERMISKMKSGCSFFISQAVYDPQAACLLLDDYAKTCAETGQKPVPVLFTLAPCACEKTMQFMKWLGIHFPESIERKLLESEDMLAYSCDYLISSFNFIREHAMRLGLPVGANIESVSIRLTEIEAAQHLAGVVRSIMKQS